MAGAPEAMGTDRRPAARAFFVRIAPAYDRIRTKYESARRSRTRLDAMTGA
jgi:hypothetical protein